jgi:hypothetical protein
MSHYTSDDYMDDGGDAFGGDDIDTVAAAEPEAVVLSGLDVAREQEQQISNIASLFECSKLDASIMLRKFAWRTERLIERFFEDPAAVRSEAGLREPESPSKRHRRADEQSSSDGAGAAEDWACSVCFCPAPRDARSAPQKRTSPLSRAPFCRSFHHNLVPGIIVRTVRVSTKEIPS